MNHSITVENEIAEMTTSVSFNSESEIDDLLKCSMCSKTLTEPRSLQCLHNFCKVCLEKYVARLRGSGKRIETFPCPTQGRNSRGGMGGGGDTPPQYRESSPRRANDSKWSGQFQQIRKKLPPNHLITKCNTVLFVGQYEGHALFVGHCSYIPPQKWNPSFGPGPTCRSEFTLKSDQNVAHLASNYFIKNMLEIMAIRRQAKGARCLCCRETAVSRCMTCEMYMCEKCSNSHAMWPIMKDHDVISVKELSNSQSPVKTRNKLHCMKHKDKILEFYCETCQKLSCMHCMVLNHAKKQHRCVSLEKILKYVAEKLEAQTTKLVQDVDNIYGELHDELTKQFDEITDYLNKVQASVSLSKSLLNRGSIEEILSSQKLIDENLDKLRKEQPRNFSPVNDGGIQYSPEDISTIGCGEIMRKMGNITSC